MSSSIDLILGLLCWPKSLSDLAGKSAFVKIPLGLSGLEIVTRRETVNDRSPHRWTLLELVATANRKIALNSEVAEPHDLAGKVRFYVQAVIAERTSARDVGTLRRILSDLVRFLTGDGFDLGNFGPASVDYLFETVVEAEAERMVNAAEAA